VASCKGTRAGLSSPPRRNIAKSTHTEAPVLISPSLRSRLAGSTFVFKSGPQQLDGLAELRVIGRPVVGSGRQLRLFLLPQPGEHGSALGIVQRHGMVRLDWPTLALGCALHAR